MRIGLVAVGLTALAACSSACASAAHDPGQTHEHPGLSDQQFTAAGSVSAIVGYRWRLVTVSRGGVTPVQVSRTAGYGLEFGPHGALLGSDSAEAFSGRYTVTGSSLTVTNIAATTAGGAGPGHGKPDPVANAVVAAMRGLFLPNGRESSTVSAAVSGTRLVTSKKHVRNHLPTAGPGPGERFCACLANGDHAVIRDRWRFGLATQIEATPAIGGRLA